MDFEPKTKRLIVVGISLIGFAVAVGWAGKFISANDALLVILPILTGFFGLLKGVD
ncbi:MAG: hypothetical protein GY714_20210 [Desulfobacterales bacterium]|nr:hypothetical protein [Desulfobacterales bacterium]